MIPPQAKLIIGVALAVILFLAGFQVSRWQASGKIEKLRSRAEAAEGARDQALRDIEDTKVRLEEMARLRDEANRKYVKAINEPPEIVVEYRDRWKTVEKIVTSTDCREGVAQLFEGIHNLPERPR
jgi:hypothetical protein